MQPTHEEAAPLERAAFKNLTTFCLDAKGRLLACDAGAKCIRILDGKGRQVDTWTLDFEPYAICTAPDGQVYIGGVGRLIRCEAEGRVVDRAELGPELAKARPSGMAASVKDVFVAFGKGWSVRSISDVFRFGRDLSNRKLIAGNLHGCCQRLDLTFHKDVLYVAENARYRVVRMDREGRVLGTWGQQSARNVEGFGSCCNPMNLCFGPNDRLYTAESGLGRVKVYDPQGKLLSVVGYAGTNRFTQRGRLAASCSNITVAVTPDESTVYVLDFKNNVIRVLVRKTGAGRGTGAD